MAGSGVPATCLSSRDFSRLSLQQYSGDFSYGSSENPRNQGRCFRCPKAWSGSWPCTGLPVLAKKARGNPDHFKFQISNNHCWYVSRIAWDILTEQQWLFIWNSQWVECLVFFSFWQSFPRVAFTILLLKLWQISWIQEEGSTTQICRGQLLIKDCVAFFSLSPTLLFLGFAHPLGCRIAWADALCVIFNDLRC
jgi:hypothetical protein